MSAQCNDLCGLHSAGIRLKIAPGISTPRPSVLLHRACFKCLRVQAACKRYTPGWAELGVAVQRQQRMSIAILMSVTWLVWQLRPVVRQFIMHIAKTPRERLSSRAQLPAVCEMCGQRPHMMTVVFWL